MLQVQGCFLSHRLLTYSIKLAMILNAKPCTGKELHSILRKFFALIRTHALMRKKTIRYRLNDFFLNLHWAIYSINKICRDFFSKFDLERACGAQGNYRIFCFQFFNHTFSFSISCEYTPWLSYPYLQLIRLGMFFQERHSQQICYLSNLSISFWSVHKIFLTKKNGRKN